MNVSVCEDKIGLFTKGLGVMSKLGQSFIIPPSGNFQLYGRLFIHENTEWKVKRYTYTEKERDDTWTLWE